MDNVTKCDIFGCNRSPRRGNAKESIDKRLKESLKASFTLAKMLIRDNYDRGWNLDTIKFAKTFTRPGPESKFGIW